jgi:NAD(P)-dependent dehydrogenase (short-subunit alcohol dehydrogenase family)
VKEDAVGGRLAGKVAVVAGGASGIGEAVCRLFVREGVAGVVIADLNDDAGTGLAAALAPEGGAAWFRRLDITRAEDWGSLVEAVLARHGRLDVLVNSAGLGTPVSRPVVESTTDDAWDAMLRTNAKGVFLGMRAVIPAMRRSGGGSIVNIASIYAMIGSPLGTAYSASKGAVRALTRTAAVQYSGEGIRVNAVFPGYVESPMTRDWHAVPEVRRDRTAQTLLGRLGRPEDIAWGVVFLAADESAYVTGSELVIDGGVTAR